MNYFLFLLLLGVSIPLKADLLENLIEKEKSVSQEWANDDDTLPLAYLWGDQQGVELAPLLCEAIPFDELIELSVGDPKLKVNPLNFDIPRVREIFQETCLIRPGDQLLAIGENGATRVTINNVVIQRGKPRCEDDSPYSLWGLFETQISSHVFFFTTSEEWPENSNKGVWLTETKMNQIDDLLRKSIAAIVPDYQDFNMASIDLSTSSINRLLVLRRKNPTPDDDHLPNEILLSQLGDVFEKIWVERVDSKRGSGRIEVNMALDYNSDRFLDLIISGTHEKCPYLIVLEGQKEGFQLVDLPSKPCVCP